MSSASEQPRVIAGRYRLRSVLGSGSMGTVWQAYDEFLHRPVAVKEVRLPEGFPQDQAPDLRERTLREARAIAALAHPNVIVLHDVARDGGEPFVVMELLAGRSLADIVHEHGPLSTAQAAAVADAVAAALEAAHNAGITHRDVKPGNVLVGEGGQIKLTDFGIARNVSEETMTSTGVMLGSPAYIAPEVAAGSPAVPAADLWGLGATLFTAVEGKPPYDADGNPLETVGEVVHGEVPTPSPGPLAEVIGGLMNKHPDARTPLDEVRGQLFALLDAPAHSLFGPELLERTTEGPSTKRPDTTATQVLNPVAPGPAREQSDELASDPGPLPFEPAAPSAPEPATGGADAPPATTVGGARRGTAAATVLALISVVLFVAAAAGGFAAARFVGGAPLLPSQQAAPTPTQQEPVDFELVTRNGDATNLRGVTGGLFSIEVPHEWTKFVTRRGERNLTRSTLVEFVSPDGKRVLGVRRFAEFFPNHSIDEYVDVLFKRWPDDSLVPIDKASWAGDEGVRTIAYRTVQRPEPEARDTESATTRTTISRLLRRKTSLWVITVTVPTAQESGARTKLFDRVVPTFRTTG